MSTTTEVPGSGPSRPSRWLPLGVYLLAFSLFAMGSTEFLLAGVLPQLAGELRVPLSSAGALITSFALGVVIGAPPLAIATLRLPRRAAILASQAVFALAVAVGLVVDEYWVLLVTRFVGGLAYAAFWAVAAVTAVSLVPAERTARASGVVVSGLSLAMIVGGPAGALLSHFTDWRGGFWAVVALTALSAVAVYLALPATRSDTRSDARREGRAMRSPRLWWVYATTILSTAAYMITFNYSAAILTEISGVPPVWVPAILTLFGVGAFVGLGIGGRISDRHPFRALGAGALGIAASSALFATLAHEMIAAIVLMFLLGVAGFVLNPAIYGRVFTIAAQAPTLAGATTVSAFQLGISLVPVLAGAALTAGANLTALIWIGAALAALTPLPVLRERALARTRPIGTEVTRPEAGPTGR